jgi:hypothetical protein
MERNGYSSRGPCPHPAKGDIRALGRGRFLTISVIDDQFSLRTLSAVDL